MIVVDFLLQGVPLRIATVTENRRAVFIRNALTPFVVRDTVVFGLHVSPVPSNRRIVGSTPHFPMRRSPDRIGLGAGGYR